MKTSKRRTAALVVLGVALFGVLGILPYTEADLAPPAPNESPAPMARPEPAAHPAMPYARSWESLFASSH